MALSLLASVLLGGCGGEETIGDRKLRAERDMASTEEANGGAQAGSTAAPADETSMEDLQAEADATPSPAEDPAAAEEPKAKQAKKSKKSKKDRKQTAKSEASQADQDGRDLPAAGRREDSILEELGREKSLRREEALYYAKKGDELFRQNEHEEAVKHYERALRLDPTLDDTRKRLNDALTVLNRRSGVVPGLAREIFESEKVREEQARLEIQRNIDEGNAALKAGEIEKAEQRFAQAVDALNLRSDYDPALRSEANRLLKEVREKRKHLEDERQKRLLAETDRQARDALDKEARVRASQVQELLRKSSVFLRQQEYEKAIEACERILEIEPENRVAKFWIADAKDQLLRERKVRLIKDRTEAEKRKQEEFEIASNPQAAAYKFPGDDDWLRVQKRGREINVISSEDPEPIRRIKNALETEVDFTFDKTPLDDVIQQLRTVTGAKIGVDPQIDGKAQTVSGTFQRLPASNVLNLILENVGLTYVFKENILFITNPGQKAGNTEFLIYNVSDILNKIRDFTGPELILRPTGDQGETPISFTSDVAEDESQLDPEKLEGLIKASTGEDAWGEPNTMEYHQGQFLVNATRELHQQIQEVLTNLRKDADLFVVIEARFIDVNDDFLEDIGIDSRALGQVNNYGTPFGNVINDGRTGGQDLGFVKQGSPVRDVTLIMGQDRWAGRVRHIIDGFTGAIRGERLTAGQGIGGLTLQTTWLQPFQINTILRAVQERLDVRQLTAPVVTAHNGQRVFVSVITQRAYIADYNLVSGGTGLAIIEVADPEVQTFQEGVILDVDPVISHDKKYVTLDVRPTLATLIGGVISTILISLGSFTNVAFMVPIGIPEISLQQSFTSVTVPNGGTVLLGGFKSLSDQKFKSSLPLLGDIPLIGNLFRRKAQVTEKRSLVILLSARIVDLRGAESRMFNPE